MKPVIQDFTQIEQFYLNNRARIRILPDSRYIHCIKYKVPGFAGSLELEQEITDGTFAKALIEKEAVRSIKKLRMTAKNPGSIMPPVTFDCDLILDSNGEIVFKMLEIEVDSGAFGGAFSIPAIGHMPIREIIRYEVPTDEDKFYSNWRLADAEHLIGVRRKHGYLGA